MGIFQHWESIEEMTFFLRNSDIFTVSERGVTTTAEAGTFSSDSTHLIADSQIKNIRDITVGSLLIFGTDYTYDTDFDDSGTKKTKITFVSAQTGAYTINYDTGTDKIYPDFPKDSLSISSYPRIAVDLISTSSTPLGFGNTKIANITDALFTIVVYDKNTKVVNQHLDTIRTKIQANQNSFFFFNITTPGDSGPMIEGPSTRKDIFHRNTDFVSSQNIERE